MSHGRDLTGKRFGHLTVTEKTEKREEHYTVWRCRCDCGKEIYVNTKRLTRGTVRDCGCVPRTDARRGSIAEDLRGRRFGELTVLERAENRNGRTCWLCRCSCGREKIVPAHDLKAEKTRSCGAPEHKAQRRSIDLRGRTFGRLTALYPTTRRDRRGSVYWHCVCTCGNEKEFSEASLMHGNCRSCGCLKAENQKKISSQLHMVDGTCIEMLEKRKYRNDNTSGFRGVYRMKNGKFRVNIGFKGRRFYLGSFERYGEAVRMRKEAEEMIHGGFVQAYRRWQKKAEADPVWKEANPLIFEVEMEKGTLQIRKNI
ncbi:MAG TPA: transcriptional regulator [Candidatus Mediterraneibacter cottocaccae]|nr:transcriptional regulator [Candidatus Mediterraneibacter cottocaccae]